MKKPNEQKVFKNDEEWKEILNQEEYHVLRENGTERPFTGLYNTHTEAGNYYCRGCNSLLFSSDYKFDSGCGWPSFDQGNKENIKEILDQSHGMTRMEVRCNNCDSHLGHIFPDGPTETGMRYCINSVSLNFEKRG